jgi:hypothetical protein
MQQNFLRNVEVFVKSKIIDNCPAIIKKKLVWDLRGINACNVILNANT